MCSFQRREHHVIRDPPRSSYGECRWGVGEQITAEFRVEQVKNVNAGDIIELTFEHYSDVDEQGPVESTTWSLPTATKQEP